MISTKDDFDYTNSGFGDLALGYSFDSTLSARAGYRYVRSRNGGEWRTEHRPFLAVSHSTTWKDFKISNRPRIEFRDFDYKDNDVRMRHQIRIEPPWTFTPLNLRLYIEEELFFSIRSESFAANWFSFGVSYKPTDHLKIKLGHRWITQAKDGERLYHHTIHTTLSLSY